MITMKKYIINNEKRVEKKSELKRRNDSILQKLQDLDLEKHFSPDYISQNGNTIHDFKNLIDKISHCSEQSVYKSIDSLDFETGEIETKFDLVQSHSCHCYSGCLICASNRRAEIINSVRPYLKCIDKMNGVYPYMITITIPTGEDIAEKKKELRKSWTRFMKLGQRRKSGKRDTGEASKIIGGIMAIEIKKSLIEGNYHVHGHSLIVTDKPLDYRVYDTEEKKKLIERYGYGNIPHEELDKITLKTIPITRITENGIEIEENIAVSKISEEWHRASGTAINFDVKPMRDRYRNGHHETIEEQIYEVIKYESKSWELSGIEFLKVWDANQGTKTITKSGIFTKVKYYREKWRSLLSEYDLESLFNEFYIDKNDPIEDIDDPVCIDGVPKKTVSYIELFFNPDKGEYGEETSKTDYSYLESDDWKTFLRNRAHAVNDYRKEFSILKQFIGKMKNIDWIKKKLILQEKMKARIKNHAQEFWKNHKLSRLIPSAA